jgi:hypothetical protein
LTNLTLLPDLTALSTLALDNNPLTSLVLSEPLAANLALVIANLRNQGVSVSTYPIAVSLALPHRVAGSFEFTLVGPPGSYAILASTNLTGWSALATVTNQLGSAIFTDAISNPSKFYRAQQQGPPQIN